MELLLGCCYAVVRWKLECFGWVVARVLLCICEMAARITRVVGKVLLRGH